MTDEGRLKYIAELNTEALERAASKVDDSFRGMTRTAEQEGDKIDAVMKKLGGAIAGYFSFQAATQFAKSLIDVRSQIESLEISFSTLLGSEQAAAKLFGEIREYAVSTPLQLGDLASSAQTLLAFNIEAEKIMPTLRALGDISMGDSQKLQSLTLAFAQMSSAGKLMGQDLLQMINAGFNPLSEISKKTGKSIGELKDEMSKGAISVEMVTDAFMSATSEGGKFFGMLEKQSHGIAGSLSNLKGAFDDMLNDLGGAGQDAFVGAVNTVTEVVKNYKEAARIIADIAIVYGTAKAALIAYNATQAVAKAVAEGHTVAQVAQAKATTILEAAQKKLNKTMLANPYAIAAAAIAALVIGMTKLYKKSKEAEQKQREFNESLSKSATEINGAAKELDVVVTRLQKAKKGTEEYSAAVADLQDRYGDYLTNLNIEAETLATSADNQLKLRDAIVETTKARARDAMMSGATSDYNDAVDKYNKSIIKQLEKLYGDESQYAGVYARIQEMISRGVYVPIEQGISKIFGEVNKEGIRGVRRVDVINDINAIIKETDEFQRKQNAILDAFGNVSSVSGTKADDEKKTKELSDEERKRIEDQRKARQKAIDDAVKQIEEGRLRIGELDREMQMDVRQALTDAMEDGFDKTVSQIEIDFDRAKDAIEKKYGEIVKVRQDLMNAEAVKNNTKAGTATLSNEEQANMERELKANEQRRKASEKAVSDAILAQYRTYEQQRTAILEEYEKRREEAVKAGAKDGNLKELERQKQETLNALDKQIASRSAQYQEWLRSVSMMNLKQLYDTLEKAEAELTARQALGESGTEVGELQVKVEELLERIAELQGKIQETKTESADAADVSRWSALNNAIGIVSGSVSDLLGSIEGLSEDATKALQFLINTLDKIADIAISDKIDSVSSATDGVASAASEAARSYNSATTALSIFLSGLNLMIQRMQAMRRNNKDTWSNWLWSFDFATGYVDKLQDRLSDFDFYGATGTGVNAFGEHMRDIIQSIADEYDALRGDIDGVTFASRFTEDERVIALIREEIDKLDASVLRVTGDAKLDRINTQLDTYRKLIEQATIAAAALREEAREVKDPDKSADLEKQSEEYERIAGENAKAMMELMNQTMDTIVGTADSIAKSLSDALETAFQNGTDAAKAWSDEVNKLVKNIVTQLLIDQYLTPKIQSLIDGLGIIDENGNLRNTDYIIGQMEGFKEGLNGLMEGWRDVYTAIRDQFDFDGRSATQGGFAQASQESIDELNGRATAIQGHTSVIAENTHILVSNSNAILGSVRSIENTVQTMNARINDMAEDIQTINSKL